MTLALAVGQSSDANSTSAISEGETNEGNKQSEEATIGGRLFDGWARRRSRTGDNSDCDRNPTDDKPAPADAFCRAHARSNDSTEVCAATRDVAVRRDSIGRLAT